MTLEEWKESLVRKVIVTGGRFYNNMSLVWSKLDYYDPTHIAQGGATGADKLALDYAKDHGLKWKTYHANWDKYGNAAGPLRNEIMCRENQDAIVLAFPGNNGTQSCIDEATKLEMLIIQIKGNE
jgi:hypothetical protein